MLDSQLTVRKCRIIKNVFQLGFTHGSHQEKLVRVQTFSEHDQIQKQVQELPTDQSMLKKMPAQ